MLIAFRFDHTLSHLSILKLHLSILGKERIAIMEKEGRKHGDIRSNQNEEIHAGFR